MTAKNRLIAKYRLMGLGIIFIALLTMSFAILLVQEQQQYAALARTYQVTYR